MQGWEQLDWVICKLSAWASVLCFCAEGFDSWPPTKGLEAGSKLAVGSCLHHTLIRALFYCLHISLPLSGCSEASQNTLGQLMGRGLLPGGRLLMATAWSWFGVWLKGSETKHEAGRKTPGGPGPWWCTDWCTEFHSQFYNVLVTWCWTA